MEAKRQVPGWGYWTARAVTAWKNTSSETQGQIVGTRESLNARKNMTRRKVKNGEKKINGSSRRSLLFFACFLRVIFFRPFRLSLAPFICPWVSEDGKNIALPIFTRSVTEIPEYRRLITHSNKHGCPFFCMKLWEILFMVFMSVWWLSWMI